MQVRVIRSFVAKHDGKRFAGNVGDLLEMPAGADWIRAKFAEPVIDDAQDAPEVATIEPNERAVMPKTKAKKG